MLLAGLSLLALGALTSGLAIWAHSFALFVVGTAIFGCGQGPSTLGRAAAADLYPPMLRGRGVGTVATAGAVGAVSGPLIAIAAGGRRGSLGIVRQAGPFLVVPVLGVVAVWLIGTMRPDPREVASDLTRWYRKLPPIPEPPPPRPRAELIRLAPARAAITATALVQAAMVGVMSITAVELGDSGWADWQVQLLMAAHFIGMFALAYPVGMLADRIGRRRTSLLAVGVCAAGAFGTAVTGASPLITPFFFLLGLGWAGCVRGRHVRARGHHVAARARRADREQRLHRRRVRGRLVALRRRAALGRGLLGRRAWSSARCSLLARAAAPAPPGADRRRRISRAPAGRARRADRSSARRDALDEALHGAGVGRHALAALGALVQVGERGRQRRRDARGALDGLGELGRMGRGERDERRVACPARARPAVRPTAVWGSSRVPLRAYSPRIAASVASSSSADGLEQLAQGSQRPASSVRTPVCANADSSRAVRSGSRP